MNASCAAAFESSSSVLLFPRGPASVHFYGRAVLVPSRGLVTLFGAQQREQNECIYLHGAGDTVYDVGLLTDGGAECVVGGVMASGGTLARLTTAGWDGGGGAVAEPPPALAFGDAGTGPPPVLAFEPSALVEGALAAAAAGKYFPEVPIGGLEDALLCVFGTVRAANLCWRPRFQRAEGAGGGAAPPPADSVVALLERF